MGDNETVNKISNARLGNDYFTHADSGDSAGEEGDRHLLTSTPLLSEKSPQEGPRDMLAQVPLRLSEEAGHQGGEAGRPTLSPHLFIPRLTSEHGHMPGSVLGPQVQNRTRKTCALEGVMGPAVSPEMPKSQPTRVPLR